MKEGPRTHFDRIVGKHRPFLAREKEPVDHVRTGAAGRFLCETVRRSPEILVDSQIEAEWGSGRLTLRHHRRSVSWVSRKQYRPLAVLEV